jgi:hypothetical protein
VIVENGANNESQVQVFSYGKLSEGPVLSRPVNAQDRLEFLN